MLCVHFLSFICACLFCVGIHTRDHFCVLINYLPDKRYLVVSLLSSRLHTGYGTSFEQDVMLLQ